MGLKQSAGAFRERSGSRYHQKALFRAFFGATVVVAVIAVFFGTAESDRSAVGAPPHRCTA